MNATRSACLACPTCIATHFSAAWPASPRSPGPLATTSGRGAKPCTGLSTAIDPDDLEAIAAFAYMEMLEAGFTRVGEFHYLHHDRGGRPFADPAEMAHSIAAAAQTAGIGLTLLPAFYAHSGFGGAAPEPRQARFVTDIDGYAKLLDRSRPAVSGLDDALVGVAPHSLRACTPDELRAVIGLAPDGPVHIHLAEQAKEVDDCLSWCGRRPATWLLDEFDIDEKWCLVHATHVDNRELERIARSGATVGLCPITEANLGDGIFPAADFVARLRFLWHRIRLERLDRPRARAARPRIRPTPGALCPQRHGDRRGPLDRASALRVGTRGRISSTGHSDCRRAPRATADLIALDANHDDLADRLNDAVIDGWIFAARRPPIDCVWRYGRKVVSGGRHVDRDAIASRYRATIKKILSR